MKNVPELWRQERFNPWREIASLQQQMDRLLGDTARYEPSPELGTNIDFIPACDIDETDAHYLISLDIPGMSKDQLVVEIKGHTLTVYGEKREEKTGNGFGRAYERFQGKFMRSFTLPELAESEKIEADYKDGVLRISVPKSEEGRARTRRITIGDKKNPLFSKPPVHSEEGKKGEKAA